MVFFHSLYNLSLSRNKITRVETNNSVFCSYYVYGEHSHLLYLELWWCYAVTSYREDRVGSLVSRWVVLEQRTSLEQAAASVLPLEETNEGSCFVIRAPDCRSPYKQTSQIIEGRYELYLPTNLVIRTRRSQLQYAVCPIIKTCAPPYLLVNGSLKQWLDRRTLNRPRNSEFQIPQRGNPSQGGIPPARLGTSAL